MNTYKISSKATTKHEGWPQGIRTVCSSRRSPEAVARHETTVEERATRVTVEQLTGDRGQFWAGIPNEYWPK